MAWGQYPDSFSYQPLACAFFSPLAISCCVFFRKHNLQWQQEVVIRGRYWPQKWFPCSHCLSLIFTDAILWIFVVVVINAASFSKSDQAPGHMAVHVEILQWY
ncbi:Hypothetical predicted protein [Marmota monax]|uniref:Uncharacterized protein n=1 Tax=Marmota monax TaxID=9995 RepID=A0A5E4BNM0_MARMO|nr:hypothetical protein GHT09_016672 [Marmota monax]VTJ71218.1 Hypothetical predicted protein [Marmota monax]